jgi:NADH pyrophosphatase NudC (nudix superfamily)
MGEFHYCPQCGKELIKKEMEGRERLCCPSDTCGFVWWDNPLPVVAALIEKGGNIILARNKQWPEKIFGLITGFLEKGETTEAAVLREVKEELGLDAEIRELIGVYSFLERNQVIIAYYLTADGEIRLGDELAEVREIPPAKLKPWPFGAGLAVRDWLAKYVAQS